MDYMIYIFKLLQFEHHLSLHFPTVISKAVPTRRGRRRSLTFSETFFFWPLLQTWSLQEVTAPGQEIVRHITL